MQVAVVGRLAILPPRLRRPVLEVSGVVEQVESSVRRALMGSVVVAAAVAVTARLVEQVVTAATESSSFATRAF